mmetsp:Transcript_26352/g.63474  ORF Transcript_26352/g.63474 Transcript_26352/m.63474 type:complete len:92 (-) Transcript_26352:108-383(-)
MCPGRVEAEADLKLEADASSRTPGGVEAEVYGLVDLPRFGGAVSFAQMLFSHPWWWRTVVLHMTFGGFVVVGPPASSCQTVGGLLTEATNV